MSVCSGIDVRTSVVSMECGVQTHHDNILDMQGVLDDIPLPAAKALGQMGKSGDEVLVW